MAFDWLEHLRWRQSADKQSRRVAAIFPAIYGLAALYLASVRVWDAADLVVRWLSFAVNLGVGLTLVTAAVLMVRGVRGTPLRSKVAMAWTIISIGLICASALFWMLSRDRTGWLPDSGFRWAFYLLLTVFFSWLIRIVVQPTPME